jgi:glycine dehydrogenase subunit 2
VVPEPCTLEPTESYTKRELDEFAAILDHISDEAYEDPETVKTAPHKSTIHAVNTTYLDQLSQTALSWRAYKRKVKDGQFEEKLRSNTNQTSSK